MASVHVIQRLSGAELDELVAQGVLDSDLCFQLKNNSHAKGEPLLVFLTQTVALAPNYKPSPTNAHCAEVIANTPDGPTLAEIVRNLPSPPEPKPWATWPVVK